MRKYGDPDNGEVRLVLVTRREWLAARRARKRTYRGCPYLLVQCPIRGRVLVRAIVVDNGAPEARRSRSRR